MYFSLIQNNTSTDREKQKGWDHWVGGQYALAGNIHV